MPPTISSTADAEPFQGHPVHYHIFMARAAKVYHRFCRTVRLGVISLENMISTVRLADEELAGVIDTLPEHLQPDADLASRKDASREADPSEPWVTWQRFDLTLVLLHLRIRINRTLQGQWLSTPGAINTDWARTITVSSATSIIWIHKNWGQPSSMRKQWYVPAGRVAAAVRLSCTLLISTGPYHTIFSQLQLYFSGSGKTTTPIVKVSIARVFMLHWLYWIRSDHVTP